MNTYICGDLGAYFDTSPKICLAMLISNVTRDILPSLKSVVKHIDYWVIYEIIDLTRLGNGYSHRDQIHDFFQKHQIPGKYISGADYPPYIFSEHREKLFQHAWGIKDYSLYMRGYEVMLVHDPNFKRKLTDDAYICSKVPRVPKYSRFIHHRVDRKYMHLKYMYAHRHKHKVKTRYFDTSITFSSLWYLV